MLRTFFISLALICTLLLNGVTLTARNAAPKGQKSRVERKTSKAPTKKQQVSRTAKREAAKERQLLKKNPRVANLFKADSDRDVEREDQPQEAPSGI